MSRSTRPSYNVGPVWGIDAPELGEAGGPEAKAALASLIDGRTVRLSFPSPRKRDGFGRLLCDVHLDGLTVTDELVKLGHATVLP